MLDHTGHRRRVKDRFNAEGLENFQPVHALELLLFYIIPRKDTKPIARKLLDYFGSFSGVLQAPPEALMRVEGVGINTARFLNMLGQTVRYYMMEKEQTKDVFKSHGEIGRYIANYFVGVRQETLYAFALNSAGGEISAHRICEGGTASIMVSSRKILEQILAVGAHYVVFAHNHPGGVCSFSEADVFATKRMAEGLRDVGVDLLDHYVVGDDGVISMGELGLYHFERALF